MKSRIPRRTKRKDPELRVNKTPTPRNSSQQPMFYRIPGREALDVRKSATGEVGRLFTGEGIEAVWVLKRGEKIDSEWFTQKSVDLIIVLQGKLKVEFKDKVFESRIMEPNDLLVLPPNTSCRAYRWPRSTKKPTIFLAIYPTNTKA